MKNDVREEKRRKERKKRRRNIETRYNQLEKERMFRTIGLCKNGDELT